MKKTGGELEVITRRPHRDREHFPTDPNLERFFSSQIIREASLESSFHSMTSVVLRR
jgi:hypothetical protein